MRGNSDHHSADIATDESQRRVTFDQVALLGDQIRPGYPKDLFDDVVSLSRIPPAGHVTQATWPAIAIDPHRSEANCI